MINVKSKHTTALYGFEEDQDFMYMICEYCNGGDLSIEQAKQRNKVFNLEQSLEILSQVIEGL
jgi:serine/threonine protein kinase